MAALLDGPRTRRVPAPLEHGPAMVPPCRGPCAADARRGRARLGLRHGRRRPGRAEAPGARRRDAVPWPDALRRRRPSRHRTAGRDRARPGVHQPRRKSVFGTLEHSVRSWGNATDGSTLLVTGTYETVGHVERADARRAGAARRRASRRVGEPGARPAGGGGGARRRRPVGDPRPPRSTCCASPPCGRASPGPGERIPPWYAAAADPVLGPALELMHNNPAHRWTVAGLASSVGSSRAAFARRFTDWSASPH